MAKKRKKIPVKKGRLKKDIIKGGVVVVCVCVLAVLCGAFTYMLNTPQGKKEKQLEAKVGAIEMKLKQLDDSYKAMSVKITALEAGVAKPKKVSPAVLKRIKHLLKDVPSKAEIPKISLKEAKDLYDSGKAVFIDTRSVFEYEQRHIKGAIPMPVNLVHQNVPRYEKVIEGKVLVTYCHGIGCHLSDKTAYKLYDYGYKKVCIFFGGWNEWTVAKYPIAK